MGNLKYYNQEGKESEFVNRPAGWIVDASKGTAAELENLMWLLRQFEPIRITETKIIDDGTK